MYFSEGKPQWRGTGLENRRGQTQAGSIPVPSAIFAPVAQLAEASDLNPDQSWFESTQAHHGTLAHDGRGSGFKPRSGRVRLSQVPPLRTDVAQRQRRTLEGRDSAGSNPAIGTTSFPRVAQLAGGTWLRTRTVEVRILSRGPFWRGRIAAIAAACKAVTLRENGEGSNPSPATIPEDCQSGNGLAC